MTGTWVLALAALIVSTSCSGAGPTATVDERAFVTVTAGKGDLLLQSSLRQIEPSLFVVLDESAIEEILMPNGRAFERIAVANVDFSDRVLVPVFAGVSSQATDIAVLDVVVRNERVEIVVDFERAEPQPQQFSEPLVKDAYQIISIPRGRVDVRPGAVWVLIDSATNEVLSETVVGAT